MTKNKLLLSLLDANVNFGATALDSTVDRAASGDSNMFGKTPAN